MRLIRILDIQLLESGHFRTYTRIQIVCNSSMITEDVLNTKLYIPRPRLVEQLNDGLYRKLTLISAPAGFGGSHEEELCKLMQ